jgi:two-component system, response regulator YesN
MRARAIAAALALAADGLWLAAQSARNAEVDSNDRAAVIRNFIRGHLRHASVRLALARHLELSPSRTSHVVREVCGRSLQDVVSEERLRQAQRFLADSHDSVAAIGSAVGWNDPPHFARLFRRLTGVSPAQWRAEHRVA